MGDSGPSRIPGSVQREKAQQGDKQNKEKEQRWYPPWVLSAFWVKCKHRSTEVKAQVWELRKQ